MALGKSVYSGVVSPKPILDWPKVRVKEVKAVKTVNGIDIWVPVQGETCWDTPVPCTLRVNPALIADVDDSGRIVGFRIR
jgi:hypothetical protein